MKRLAIIRKNVLMLLVIAAFSFTFQSCNDDPKVSSDVLDLLPEEFYQELVDNGFIFNFGENPPTVENIYDFEPINEYDNSGVFTPGSSALLTKLKLENQVGNSLDVLIKNWTGFGEVDSSDATIIKGEGSKFTIVAQARGSVGSVTYKYDYAFTGELVSGGIKNAQFAFVMIDNPGASGVATTGTIRSFKEEDGLAEETSVFKTA
ncbi:MAG: hypothetical protein R2728_07620 [Chitinophagales bacterium]